MSEAVATSRRPRRTYHYDLPNPLPYNPDSVVDGILPGEEGEEEAYEPLTPVLLDSYNNVPTFYPMLYQIPEEESKEKLLSASGDRQDANVGFVPSTLYQRSQKEAEFYRAAYEDMKKASVKEKSGAKNLKVKEKREREKNRVRFKHKDDGVKDVKEGVGMRSSKVRKKSKSKTKSSKLKPPHLGHGHPPLREKHRNKAPASTSKKSKNRHKNRNRSPPVRVAHGLGMTVKNVVYDIPVLSIETVAKFLTDQKTELCDEKQQMVEQYHLAKSRGRSVKRHLIAFFGDGGHLNRSVNSAGECIYTISGVQFLNATQENFDANADRALSLSLDMLKKNLREIAGKQRKS